MGRRGFTELCLESGRIHYHRNQSVWDCKRYLHAQCAVGPFHRTRQQPGRQGVHDHENATTTLYRRLGIKAFYPPGNSVWLRPRRTRGRGKNSCVASRSCCPALLSIIVSANNLNLFGHGGKARTITFFTPDLAGTDIVPQVALSDILNPTLADNGRPTQTHALVTGSPAVDVVSDGTCPPPAIDQRGIFKATGRQQRRRARVRYRRV